MITIDKEFEIPEYSDVCAFCKHLNRRAKRKCAAFDIIPMEIWKGDNNHKRPYTGDNGIQFEMSKRTTNEG